MAKVLLLSPHSSGPGTGLKNIPGRYYPFGLGYLASYLIKYGGHHVQMYDPVAQGLSIRNISEIIINFKPDIIGITCLTFNFTRAIELAKLCRLNSKAKIVLGGVHASALPEFILKKYADCLDCIVVGEGEITMLELVKAYQDSGSLEGVKGIAYKRKEEIILNAERFYIENLDSIPVPARQLIPQSLYIPNMHNAQYRNCLSIITSRGCPFSCSFCAARIISGRRYRAHSPEYVLDEMEMLKKDYQARQIIITDDNFTVDYPRLERICQGMIDRKLSLKWFCFSHINTVNRKMLVLMKEAGCSTIAFGLESSDEETLRRIGKSLSIDRAKETVKLANQLGFKTATFYLLGCPGETKKQAINTLKFSRKVNSTLVFYSMFIPLPGTKAFNYFFPGVPLETIDWENFLKRRDCRLRDYEIPNREVEKIINRGLLVYYFHPKRFFNLLLHIRTIYELMNYLKGGIALCRRVLKARIC